MEKWKQLLTSRKFWAAVAGLGLVIFKTVRPDFPLDAEQIGAAAAVLAAYILGTAIEDARAG